MIMKCRTCRHYALQQAGDKFGECHRYAPHPQVTTVPTLETRGIYPNWPLVGMEDFCGDWAYHAVQQAPPPSTDAEQMATAVAEGK